MRLKTCANGRDLAKVRFERALQSLIRAENEYMLAWLRAQRLKGQAT